MCELSARRRLVAWLYSVATVAGRLPIGNMPVSGYTFEFRLRPGCCRGGIALEHVSGFAH